MKRWSFTITMILILLIGRNTFAAGRDIPTAYGKSDIAWLEDASDAILSESFGCTEKVSSEYMRDSEMLVSYVTYKKSLSDEELTNHVGFYSDGCRKITHFYVAGNGQEWRRAYSEQKAAERWIRNRTKGMKADMAGIRELYAEIAESCVYDVTMEETTAWDAITKNKGTCMAFTRLFDAELTELGIESYFILGRNSPDELHCWNAFVLDGKTYTVDVTAAVSMKKERSIWDYFSEDETMCHPCNGRTALTWNIISIW